MIKAAMFDVGGTLINAYPSVGDIYSRVAEKHGHKIDPKILNETFKATWKKRNNQPHHFNKNWWRLIVQDVFAPYTISDFDSLFEDLYREFKNPAVWNVYPGTNQLLAKIKDKGFILAVASNWDDRLPQLLKDLDLEKYFDEQFISYAMGSAKPDPQFFRKCLEILKLKGEQVVHVGDNEQNDLIAPQKVGIKSFLINNDQTLNKIIDKICDNLI